MIGALLALLLIAAGCTKPEPPDEIPVPGGALRVGVRSLDSIDPQRAADSGALLLARSRFRGLMSLGEDGSVVPGLAESFSVRRSGRVFEFVLRPELRFSSGSAITPRNVVRSFNRLVDPGTRSPHAYLLDAVEGFGSARSGEGPLSGVIPSGKRKVIFRLTKPFFGFETHLAHPALGIVPPKLSRGVGPGTASSGPFILESFEAGVSASLRRNPRAPVSTALMEELDLVVVADGARSLRNNAVDIAYLSSPDPERLIPRWGTLSLGVNLQRIPKRNLRRAIQAGIDREALARGASEPWLPLSRLLPEGLAPDAGPLPGKVGDWNRSGAITFAHLDDEASVLFATRTASQLRAGGIRVKLRSVARDRYAQVLAESDYDLVQLGWLTEVPSPDGFIARQLGSASADNQVGFKDERLDELIEIARSSRDDEARAKAYLDAEMIAFSEAPLIPVVQLGVGFDIGPRVRSVSLDGSGTFDPAVAWMVPAKAGS